MDQAAREIAVLEILRISVISLRNLAHASWWRRRIHSAKHRQIEWSEMCHTLPSVILGGCNEDALKWFFQHDAATFLRRYPHPSDAEYKQVAAIIAELCASLGLPAPNLGADDHSE